MLQECLEVGPRQHSDPSGSISTPNPDEGPGRVQGMQKAKHGKRALLYTQYRHEHSGDLKSGNVRILHGQSLFRF